MTLKQETAAPPILSCSRSDPLGCECLSPDTDGNSCPGPGLGATCSVLSGATSQAHLSYENDGISGQDPIIPSGPALGQGVTCQPGLASNA